MGGGGAARSLFKDLQGSLAKSRDDEGASKACGGLESGNGENSVDGLDLVNLGLDGRPHTGLKSLQLAEASAVEMEESVNGEHGSQNAEDDRGTAAEDSDGRVQGTETCNGP